MKRLKILYILWLCLTFIIGCSSLDLSKNNSDYDIRTIHFTIYANDLPQINGADPPLFEVPANSTIQILSSDDAYTKISLGDSIGWIPSWYLTDEVEKINAVSPYLMLVYETSSLFLYPHPDALKYDNNYKLESGKAVKVIAEYEDWYCIKYINYSEPEYDPTWLRKNNLTDYNHNDSKEGYVSNAILYSDNYQDVNERINGFVEKQYEEDRYYYVIGTGGLHGFIEKKAFNMITVDDIP